VKGFGPETFGERNADRYDRLNDAAMAAETRDSVAALADLAGGGRVLELAIGTGRVALPLAAQGLEVHGIEASEAMVAKMRTKPGGDAIPVTIGDMADARAEGAFDLVYLVFNTIFNLTTQDAQVRCFQNAARHLGDGGVFVVETIVPELSRYEGGQVVRANEVELDRVRFEVAMHDPIAQTVRFQRVVVDPTGTRLHPHFMRYAWPSELDLMARLAGLALRERWAWWDRSSFTERSTSHVSIYAKAPATA
jgi:SAM-dependent methyltransferase